MSKKLSTALLVLLGLSQAAWSVPPKGNGPPAEALEACDGKSEGDSVSFETRRGDTLESTCRTIEEQLVAVPNNHKPKKRQ
jgi:hypothetical protein